jgi:hypothetical protein
VAVRKTRWTTNPTTRRPKPTDEEKKLLAHVESQRTSPGWSRGAKTKPVQK